MSPYRFSPLALILLPVMVFFTTAAASPAPQDEQRGSRVWWIVVGLLLVLGALWWLAQRRREEEIVQSIPLGEHVSEALAEKAPAAESPAEAPPPAEPDDLKVIEGIGPKIERLLHDAGILTYAQLAATDVERLRDILTEAKLINIADPTTWPEQAALAAEGRWEELKALQAELKGGRRVA